MKFLRHIFAQPFIFATGLAALIHSTWSLGTLFAGKPPALWSLSWWGWIIPAALIAFALDVGQIATSAQIRGRGMTVARGLTFAVFALATYYLQWLFVAHHMPALVLAPGVQAFPGFAMWLRDMAVWLLPALLPLSTLLYTFSSEQMARLEEAKTNPPIITVWQDPMQKLQSSKSTPLAKSLNLKDGELEQVGESVERLIKPERGYVETCKDCGWECEGKDTKLSAKRALAAHKFHCPLNNGSKHAIDNL